MEILIKTIFIVGGQRSYKHVVSSLQCSCEAAGELTTPLFPVGDASTSAANKEVEKADVQRATLFLAPVDYSAFAWIW